MLSRTSIFKYGISTTTLAVAAVIVYQNCAPVKFNTQSPNAAVVIPLGGGTCTPIISVAPQLSFDPSSINANVPFTIIIPNRNSYSSLSIDFGDGKTAVEVDPNSLATVTYTYSQQGSFTITVKAKEKTCQNELNSTQSIAIGPCVPESGALVTSISPATPTPPPIAPFNITAYVSNDVDFTNVIWKVTGGTAPATGGSSASFSLPAGSFTVQASGTDTCGVQRFGSETHICVSKSGAPTVITTPATFTAGTSSTFQVAQAETYTSLTIDFGDGTKGNIPITGATAGQITHTYAGAGSETYAVTAVDSCASSRMTSMPITVSAPVCVQTQADGCSGPQYCTGRTSCNPNGNCNSSCNLCGYTGTPISPSTTCTGTQTCVNGGTSCTPTHTCSYTCGQCGYIGTPRAHITSCKNNMVCTTEGTECNPTETCAVVPGQCGDSPTPTPTPTPPVSCVKAGVLVGGTCQDTTHRGNCNCTYDNYDASRCCSHSAIQKGTTSFGPGCLQRNFYCQ